VPDEVWEHSEIANEIPDSIKNASMKFTNRENGNLRKAVEPCFSASRHNAIETACENTR